MASLAPHEELRQARAQRGEGLDSLSARTGLRVHHVRAIEEGRFGDLPPGIYGRSAIRAFAAAYEMDADAVLAACDPLLPQVEDPIGAIARLRGIPSAVGTAGVVLPSVTAAQPGWRPFAAACVDGALAGALLCLAGGAAAILARVSVASLDRSAMALFAVALVFSVADFVWLGGVAGTTVGELAVGPEPHQRDPRPLTLRAIALRARAAATSDARAIQAAGMWVGRRLTPAAARSVLPPVPSPSPLPLPGREEVLTWSMSRRGPVPPPPLRPRRG